MSIPGSMPGPTLRPLIRSRMSGRSRSPESPTAISSVWAMQRSPAEPWPEATAASAVIAMSASGSTIIAFFALVNDPTRLPWWVPVSKT